VPTTSSRPLLRRPAVLIALAGGVVLAAVALALFQPWKLFVDQQVDEALPSAGLPASAPVAPGPVAPGPVASEPAAPGQVAAVEPPAPAAPAEPVVLARGELISHEHASSGTAQILQLADGSRVLRLADLDTSDGPLLKVWLTDAPVVDGRDGWYVFDDGRVVDLGELKGNVGSSNYPIPADADLAALTSVSIWCERFSVSFGAAALS